VDAVSEPVLNVVSVPDDGGDVVQLPALQDMPTEVAVEMLMRLFGESEYQARFMVAFAKGEIQGDCIEVADDELVDEQFEDEKAEA
jgi:hypothetical protein